MPEQTIPYNDFAIILTWPDATIRGDEKWMMFFKKIGIVKNLNFKVGHTGVVLVDSKSGSMLFYDFGRYIAPRGYGRARSQFSDPLLEIKLAAKFHENKICNLQEIVEHFELLKPAMYGEGKLFLSVVEGINFSMARKYGDQCVMQGTYPYGAVARNNNNCSRFITRMLIKSSQRFHFWHMINLPETIKSSPVSNLINTVNDRMIYSYTPQDGLIRFRMNRFQSFWFLVRQLGDNVFQTKADLLPTDQIIGAVHYRSKPITVPKEAMYLGGVGDGAWYTVSPQENKQLIIKRFTTSGKLEYVVLGEADETFDPTISFEITYDSHLLFTHILQEGVKIYIKHLKQLEIKEYTYEHIQERYA